MHSPRLPHARYVPRPGYQRASINYRLGLAIPRGYPIWVGPNYEYRQMRRRSRFALTAGTLHYLAVRRRAAVQCRQMGMQRLRPGVWYDNLADVLYAQAMAPAGHDWDY